MPEFAVLLAQAKISAVEDVLGSDLPDAEADARALFAIFAIGFIAMVLEIVLLYVRAWQMREPLRLDARERLITRSEITGWGVPVGVGLVSLVLALILPSAEIEWSGWVYFSMAILVPLHSAYQKRRLGAKAARVDG